MTLENNALQTVQVLADVATDEDGLFRDGFVKGVSEFIKGCPTPMTIAIQGDWGTGKTSLINLIETELRAKEESAEDAWEAQKYCKDVIDTISIDVWQQSIVNPRVGLFEVLLAEMASKLSGTTLSEIKSVSEFATATAHIMNAVAGNGDDNEGDSPLGSVLGSLLGLEDDAAAQPEEEFVSSEDVAVFHNGCVEALQRTAEEAGKSEGARFVVFVDGLDYINPEAAINLMEQVKTYIECPRCVFVLAIDESTVLSGAGKKLGEKAEEGRKKMLFDRYIQVPLRVPAGSYNLDRYVKSLLKDEKELSGELVDVIGTLLNAPTPRRIKRYINAMYLYRGIFSESQDMADGSLAMLLAAVILKVESVQKFNTVARCAAGSEADFAGNLQAALESLDLNDGVNWTSLPSLWHGEGAHADTAKREAFISWVRKLK